MARAMLSLGAALVIAAGAASALAQGAVQAPTNTQQNAFGTTVEVNPSAPFAGLPIDMSKIGSLPSNVLASLTGQQRQEVGQRCQYIHAHVDAFSKDVVAFCDSGTQSGQWEAQGGELGKPPAQ